MTIDSAVDVFGFDIIRQSVDVYNQIKKFGYDISDLVQFVDTINAEMAIEINKNESDRNRLTEEYAKIAPKCPECKSSLMLKGISTPEGKANKNGYKSLFYCDGESCIYEKYSRKPADYLYRQMVKGKLKGELGSGKR